MFALRSVLLKGTVLRVKAPNAVHCPSIRVLEDLVNAPSDVEVFKAVELEGKGEDAQAVAQQVGHHDPSTVRAFLRACVEARKVELDPRLRDADVKDLAKKDLERARLNETDLIEAPFVLEASGTRQEKDGELVPILPIKWIGKIFQSGSAFESELAKLPPASRPGGLKKWMTYNNLERSQQAWMDDVEALHRSLKTRGLAPSMIAQVLWQDYNLEVHLRPFSERFLARVGKDDSLTMQAIEGRRGHMKEESERDNSIVLAVSKELLKAPSPKEPPKTRGRKSAASSAGSHEPPATDSFLPRPSELNSEVDFPMSVLERSILRGQGFASPRLVCRSIECLTRTDAQGHSSGSATFELLWRTFVTSFAHVAPYRVSAAQRGELLSLAELFGLSLVAHTDTTFRLDAELEHKVKATALALQNCEGQDVLWPWRGFRKHKDADSGMTLEETSSSSKAAVNTAAHDATLRNAIRGAIGSPMPLSEPERDMFRRHLTGLEEEEWTKKLVTLPTVPLPSKADMRAPLSDAEVETIVAGASPKYAPHSLLLVQSALPFPPRNPSQHSIKALKWLEGKVSSELNIRKIRRQLAGKEEAQEMFRIEQFVGSSVAKDEPKENASSATSSVAAAATQGQEPDVALPSTVTETLKLTDHEKIVNRVIKVVQESITKVGLEHTKKWDLVPRDLDLGFGTSEAVTTKVDVGPSALKLEGPKKLSASGGRQPSDLEKRTAFLQLFGRRQHLKVEDENGKEVTLSVVVGGEKPSKPLLVREASKPKSTYLEPDHFLVRQAVKAIKGYKETLSVSFPPPSGFMWKWGDKIASVDLEIRGGRGRAPLGFFVDGVKVPAFDASSVLVPCNEPHELVPMDLELARLIEEAFYVNPLESTTEAYDGHPIRLHHMLDARARGPAAISDSQVFDWSTVMAATKIDNQVFRDLVLKITMRERDTISFSAAESTSANFSSEGTGLRVCMALCTLYPACIERIPSFDGFRFRIKSISNVQFVDMMDKLRHLAFNVDACTTDDDAMETDTIEMEISTKLWEHQQHTHDKVMSGIKNGMRGFADASCVGAGKTLSALSIIASCQGHLLESGRTPRGSLVLLPTNALIEEWIKQIMLHTRGVNVLVQNAQGFLKSRGVSDAGHQAMRARGHAVVTPNSVVVTTLARAREHPFQCSGWDMVVIDECLAVQNDTAKQASSAWRQCVASSCGTLMLSATFFRSQLSKLYYMIRMLRSPLPRTEAYLPALLNEHAIVFVPESPRKWTMEYRAAKMTPDEVQRYRKTVEQGFHGGEDMRSLYVTLKDFLRRHYDPVPSMVEEVGVLQAAGHRPLVFAAHEQEKKALLEALGTDKAEGLVKSNPNPSKVLVVTVAEGSHGLNLQDRADAIVTRPQPGDMMEQMKGRVDRPGQAKSSLKLVVVVAHNTIEEAEAANIRLCGAFFREYLEPQKIEFVERAITASVATSSRKELASATSESSRFKRVYKGIIAKTFVDGLGAQQDEAAETAAEMTARGIATKATSSSSSSSTNSSASASPKKRRAVASKDKQAPKAKKPRVKKPPIEAFVSESKQVLSREVIEKALQHIKANDSKMGAVVDQIGAPSGLLDGIGKAAPFQALARSIVFQQISTKAGASIFSRLLKLAGGSEDEVTPSRLLELSVDDLRSCGVSRRKAEYIHCLAQHFVDEKLTRESFVAMSDAEILRSLIKVKGIGEWSVHMFLMFSLGRTDVLPHTDLVVRQAMKRLYNLDGNEHEHDTKITNLPGPNELLDLAKKWAPYRSVACWLCWHAIESDSCTYSY